MKRLFLILILLLPLLVTLPVKAQTIRTDSTELVSSGGLFVYKQYTAGYLKGTDTAVSKSFTRQDWDSVYNVYARFSNIRDSVKITVKIQDSPDGTNWRDLRTLVSAATVRDSFYVKEDVFTEIPYVYRFIIYGTSGNGYSTNYKLWLYCKRE